ncbi:hypothetical protein [Enterococcus mundtii]|nr:hypothetical protein [Enterococcus mundtii]
MEKQESIRKMESLALRYSNEGKWPHVDTWNAYVRSIGMKATGISC